MTNFLLSEKLGNAVPENGDPQSVYSDTESDRR
jgi:hypothetical protein